MCERIAKSDKTDYDMTTGASRARVMKKAVVEEEVWSVKG